VGVRADLGRWRRATRRTVQSVGAAALFTSRRIETAWFEAQQGLASKAQPLTICAYEVDCADVVDLF